VFDFCVRESIEMFRKAHATLLSIGPREHIAQVFGNLPLLTASR
jgi:hypothetical protein